MKVKLFVCATKGGIEKKVNKLLAELSKEKAEIIDVQFSAGFSGYCALVRYNASAPASAKQKP